jgi:tripartite-type tricarboxylate transporter receptor subunit TctC
VQYGAERHPDLRNVPTALEATQTAEGRRAFAFYISGAELGRSLVMPPEVPADRVNLLRTAFQAMLQDPEFLAEIEKSGQEFQPASGERVERLVREVANAPRDIVDRVEAILRVK